MRFKRQKEHPDTVAEILSTVYDALKEKGYDPINQLVGYIISGDPTYITSYKNARYLIRRLERDEILEEIIGYYLTKLDGK
ncbi:MAG: IreB family regulatory phosphoprotein [Clostridiales bacterium]|nr:IreB family regulatory phosphoprotein [Clostridiales bacterium]